MSNRKGSSLTATDLFCGAGGSTIGAVQRGIDVRIAVNHWDRAIESHSANFPGIEHDTADISMVDPRRYRATNILIASPECTNHSLAKGHRRKGLTQGDLFVAPKIDAAAERSRVTMFDVPRFCEYHRYEIVIVENVVDARYWELWDAWIHAMDLLGYRHRSVFLNSMFAHPTPQSRDRMYVVFWRKGNRAPDLEITPTAPCARCGDVNAVQCWNHDRTWGRYKRQYWYHCPRCNARVDPYYYAALNAIDFSVPGQRIGDRTRELKPRTLARIRYGLRKYGQRPLIVRTNMTSGVGCRVRALEDGAPLDAQPGCNITALVAPTFLMHAGSNSFDPRAADDTMPTLTTTDRVGLVAAPFTVHTRQVSGRDCRVRSVEEPLGTQTTYQDFGIAFPKASYLVDPAALIALRDMQTTDQLATSLAGPTYTEIASGPQQGIASRTAFLRAGDLAEAASAADVDVNDAYFRMITPTEIGAAMAFPRRYQVLGNQREQVRQYGNAVTPPAMAILIERAIASLEGDQ
jgi:DNA (cytosine-5)-methyltransferase 1